MTNKQKKALKEVVAILREMRGDHGHTTPLGYKNKIDEKSANLALFILVEAKLAPKDLLRLEEPMATRS